MNKKHLNTVVIISFCFCLALFFCFPFLNGSIMIGPDTAFHINRIEALHTAIINKDFMPSIFYFQNFNFGYGSPMFYSIFFLYFPALLRILGTSIFNTYHIFLFLCVFFASLTMYHCAQRILGENKQIFTYITVLIYICNCFYISDFYKRGAVGQVLAYIFVPIVIIGMINSVHGKLYTKNYALLFGFCALLLSHNITFVIMVGLYAFYLIVNYKILFKDINRIKSIVLIAILAFLITCFFTIPMLEQLLSERYNIRGYFGTSSLANLAMNFKDIFDYRTDSSKYLNDSLGPFMLFIPLLYIFAKNKNKTVLFLILSGYAFVLMTTNLFPWNFFKMLSFMQFPTRLLVPAASLLSLSAGYSIANLEINQKSKSLIFLLLSLSIVGLTSYQLYGVFNSPGIITKTTNSDEIKNDELFLGRSEWYNLLELSTPDYLPMSANMNYRYHPAGIMIDNIQKSEVIVDKSYNELTFTQNFIQDESSYVVPLTYYKGYVVEIFEGNELLEVKKAYKHQETGLVEFKPSSFPYNSKEISFKIFYNGTLLQSLTKVISFSTLIFLLLNFLKEKKIEKFLSEESIFSNENGNKKTF